MVTYGDVILWFNCKIEKLKLDKNPSSKYIISAYKNVIQDVNEVYPETQLMTKNNIEKLDLTTHMTNKLKWFLSHHKQVLSSSKICPVEKTDTTNMLRKQLMEIKGIGPKKASELIKHGVTKVSDLKLSKYANMLDTASKTYIKHNPGRISYEDISKLELRLKPIKIKHQIVGSYRRKKKDSGDIDILVFGKDPIILHKFAEEIKKRGVSLWIYSSGKEKISTIAKLPKKTRKVKLDLFRVPPGEEASFLLYATGSGLFNRNMRSKAKTIKCVNKKGEPCKYLLNQHGLYKIPINQRAKKDIERVPTMTEKDIFEEIKMKYISPENRF